MPSSPASLDPHLVGSWTETVAQALLVLQLTHSGLWLGLATAARYLPVLLLTPYAGLIVDRADKRTVLLITQASLAALWSTAFVGSTPIGATIIGAIGTSSPRLALAVGGAACGAAAITGIAVLAHSRTTTRLIPRLGRG